MVEHGRCACLSAHLSVSSGAGIHVLVLNSAKHIEFSLEATPYSHLTLALCLRDINSYYGKLAKAKAKAAQVESRWFVYLHTVCTQVA